MIYRSADAETSGVIDRVQLKEAIIANKERMNEVIELGQPSSSAIVDQVMDTLNSTSSGKIQQREFKKALLVFNDENQTSLDVDQIIKDVFKNKPTLDRSIIREKMKHNK